MKIKKFGYHVFGSKHTIVSDEMFSLYKVVVATLMKQLKDTFNVSNIECV